MIATDCSVLVDVSEAAPNGLAAAPTGGERVLLVTTCWWPSLAHFAHLLINAGCLVSVLCPRGHAVEAVDGAVLYRQSAMMPSRRLSAVIRKCQPSLIVPADDRAVLQLQQLFTDGSASERALIERSIGSSEGYRTTVSRVGLHALAQRLEIAAPANAVVRSLADLEKVLVGNGPWVLKADGAWSGHGVRIIRHRRAALKAARSLQRRRTVLPALNRLILYRDPFWLADSIRRSRPELSVQGFVEGWPSTLAMFCSEGKVLASTTADVVASLDETGPSVIIRLVHRPDALKAAQVLAAALKLSGFCGLDFMIEADTGRALLIEMNPRLTPVANTQVGIAGDLVGAAIHSISGRVVSHADKAVMVEKVAHFPLPQTFEANDPRLVGAFSNVPRDSPALVAALQQRPWPDRRVLARMVARWRQTRTRGAKP